MKSRTPYVLIADDQKDVLEAIRILLKNGNFQTETFTEPEALIEALKGRDADAVLMDLNYTRDTTSGEEGLDAVARIRTFDPHTPVIVMTAWGSIEVAVEAMRRGAQDFVEKPWDNTRLLNVLRTQVALHRARRRATALENENRTLRGKGEIIAECPEMRRILDTIDQVAPTDANVLLTGESGTGKGLVARTIHDRSSRCDNSLVVVDVGSFAESVFESEMFGHVQGAFTDAKSDRVGRFELADGGTLFLDEIANIPVAQQARLLRVLENGEFERLGSSRTRRSDMRVIAATNSDIDKGVEAGRFRRDLLYRLNTIHLHLPALRDRGDDLVLLAQSFLRQHAEKHRRRIEGTSDAAMSALRGYAWPGNVRELNHVLERAVLMCRGARIEPADLRLEASTSTERAAPVKLADAERNVIAAALDRHDGNANAAAKELGLSRSAMYRRMEKYGL